MTGGGDTPLPEEIVVWEILVRLPPKSLLRCRAVCPAWRHATSTRPFVDAHHRHQPSLPIVTGSEQSGAHHRNILAFDRRAARLQPVARLNDSLTVEASCDGLLVLSSCGFTRDRFSVCNPATRQHAPLRQLPSGFNLLGMYAHHPTGEYRLLLHRTCTHQICCFVFVLGSDDQPPRYIGRPEVPVSASLNKPALLRDCLHWYPVHYKRDAQQDQAGSKVIVVFDTTSESFRHMRAPLVPAKSYVFEMDGTLGIYAYKDSMQVVCIWMCRNYESELWTYKHRVRLPALKIKEWSGRWSKDCYVNIHSVDGDIMLLVNQGGLMFHVDIKGNLVQSFHRDGQHLYACQPRLKQTLVSHTFFTTLEGYGVNALPFV